MLHAQRPGDDDARAIEGVISIDDVSATFFDVVARGVAQNRQADDPFVLALELALAELSERSARSPLAPRERVSARRSTLLLAADALLLIKPESPLADEEVVACDLVRRACVARARSLGES